MTDLTGQTALVTGASRGLGAAVALRLARAGLRVALAARSADDLDAVAGQIRDAGGTALPLPLDVRDRDAIDAAVAQVHETFGPVEVLVNNAGLSWYKPFLEWTREELDTTLAVNLTGLVHVTHAVLPAMIERGRGTIVNVASDIGRRVIPNMAAYVAAKHGVVGFSGSLLREVREHGIRVTALLPGVIDTHFGGGEPGTRDETWALRPEVVADVVHDLAAQPPYVVLDEVTIHPLQQDF